MSLFFGLWGRDGRPVAEEDLVRMQRAHSQLPADASGLWRDGEVAFGLIQQYHIPESPYELFPYHGDCGDRYAIVSHARLDNREELLRLFDVPHERIPLTPDTKLLAMAYGHWGEAFAEHLAGDWACAVWNHDRRRLLLALAPTGNCALYYTDKGPYFGFSSTPHGLLALPWVSKTPDVQAVGYLVFSAMDRIAESAFFEDIRTLPPAHLLIVEQGRVETREFWRPERAVPLRLRDDGEYHEAFLEQYRRAVACRLRTYHGIGATLSGGLDSGSVVALAARALQSEGRPLPVFSAVPRFALDGCLPAGRCGDETPYILATAKAAGNVEVNLLRSLDTTPLDGISACTLAAGAPVYGASNCYWILGILRQAQQRGLRVLLTGQGGNATVSWEGSRLCWDYLNGTSSGQALWSMTRWLGGHGVGTGGKILLRGLLPTAVLSAYMRLRGHRSTLTEFMNYTPLRHDFIASLDLKKYIDTMDAMLLHGSNKVRQMMIESSISVAGRFWYVSGAAYGVDVRDPTLDKGLIEFLLSIPEEQFSRDMEQRRLIRRGMERLLPHKVRYPEERGVQGADIIYRIRDNSDEILDALTNLEQNQLAREVLDLASMRKVATRAMGEVSPELTVLSCAVLCRGLSAGMFLARYS